MTSLLPPHGAAQAAGELDDLLQASFDLITEATCVLAGFGVAALMVRVGPVLRNVSIWGSDDAREALLGTDLALSDYEASLTVGERHGLYVFLPADGDYPVDLDVFSWIPPLEASEDPRRWHPHDALVAPLLDEHGELIGLLSLDLPADGRRPSGEDWDRLQVYAEHARDALLVAFERVQVAEQLRQLETARDLIRDAVHLVGDASAPASGDEDPLAPVLRRVGETLVSHFKVAAAWFHVFAGPGQTPLSVETSGPRPMPIERQFLPFGEPVARRLWSAQELAVIGRHEWLNVDEANTAAVEVATTYLREHDAESMLYAPLGTGTECFGLFILVRGTGAPGWTEVEREAILEIGRDLGVLVAGVFSRQRDEEVLSDLRALESYKSRLIATVSHELKNPLAALATNLELLHDASDPAEAAQLIGAVRRSSGRMSAIVTDLQSLGSAGGAALRDVQQVDLGAVVQEVCALTADSAERRGLDLHWSVPAGPVMVSGVASDLDRLVGNLVSNAVKYTPAGGEVRVTLEAAGTEAVLTVADNGIGIAPQDQPRLFEEFFRSSDAAALAEPGTGLGLAIVRRIVDACGGRIEVESEPGVGSTFRVLLPGEVAR